MNLTRRGLFGLFAGSVAAPAIAEALTALPAAPTQIATAGFSFSPAMTLSLDDFEDRYIKPWADRFAKARASMMANKAEMAKDVAFLEGDRW